MGRNWLRIAVIFPEAASGFRTVASGQSWVKSSFSHNLVVVDEEEQANRECGSDLELFGVAPGIEVVQASGVNVYPQCEEYRRACVMVTTPEGQTYFVDFFRVKGGRTHQYSFPLQRVAGGNEAVGACATASGVGGSLGYVA